MNEHLERIKELMDKEEKVAALLNEKSEELQNHTAYQVVSKLDAEHDTARKAITSAISDYKAIAANHPDNEFDFIKVVNRSAIEFDEEEGLAWALEQKNTDVLKLDVNEYKKLEPAAKTLGLAIKKVFTKQYQFQNKAFLKQIEDDATPTEEVEIPF